MSLVIDCSMMAHTKWWPVRAFSYQGVATGLEYGFLGGVLQSVREVFPEHQVVLAWDGAPKRCKEIYPRSIDPQTGKEIGYKSNRVKHRDQQMEAPWGPRLHRLRQALVSAFTTLYHPDTEADEQIARWVGQEERAGRRTIIFSRDEDLQQLVSPLTSIRTKHSDPEITFEMFSAKWDGLQPHQLVLWKTLVGDDSDNIPSVVPRLPAPIKKLLAGKNNTLEEMLAHIERGDELIKETWHEKIKKNLGVLKRNHSLVNLYPQKEIAPEINAGTVGDTAPAKTICRELGMSSLLDRQEWNLVRSCQT